MPVRYRRHDGGHVSDFYFERSLDLIFSPGCFIVEIDHTHVDVGLPIDFCGKEHYIVGTLIVTDSGNAGRTQKERAIGQVLMFTDRESRETRLYSRTFAAGEWSEWRCFTFAGMFDKITTTDELILSVETLVEKMKNTSSDIFSLEKKLSEGRTENSFTQIGETSDAIIDRHTFFKNVRIEYFGSNNTIVDLSSVALSVLRKGHTEGKAEIRWSAMLDGKRDYVFGLNELIDLSNINNDGYTHVEQENTVYGVKIIYDVDLKNPNFPVNSSVFPIETEPTMVVSRNCVFKTVESYYRRSFNNDFLAGYYKITKDVIGSTNKVPVNLTASSGASCVEIDVVEGETYYIKAMGTGAVATWAVIDSERNILQYSEFGSLFDGELVIPKAASHLIVNNISNALPALVKVISPIDDFSALYKRVAENSVDASQAKNLAEEANGKAVEVSVAVDDLKKTFLESYDDLFVENNGYYIKLNSVTVENNIRIDFTPIANSSATYAIVDVAEGEKYTLTCKGSAYVASWAVIDRYDNVLEHSGFSNDAIVALEKVMPKGASRLIVNNFTNANTPSVVLTFKTTEDTKALYEKCSELGRWSDTINVLNGKRVLCLGDSITEIKGYYDGGLRYSDYIAKKTGAVVYNGGFGGAHMEQRTELTLNPTNEHNARAALDLPAIATALTTGEWNYQDAANEYLTTNGDDNSAIIEVLKGVNLQEIDVVTIFIGTNDKDSVIGEIGDTTAVGNSLGGLYTAISKLLTANPNISIYYFSPIVRYFGKLNEAWDYSLWCDNYVGARGVAFPDMVNKFIEGARYWKIPVCDMYHSMGVNQFNIKAIMDATNGDGTHPTRGYKMIANKMISFIAANNNLNV